MTDEHTAKNIQKPGPARILVKGGMLLLLLLAVVYAFLWVYIGTPSAAARLSGLLTGFIHQPAKVAGLKLRGGTIVIAGLTIENPAGFDGGHLFSSRSIVIAPAWGELLSGKRGLALLKIEGGRVAISKNRGGAWNFARITEGFVGRKSPTETFIKKVVLEDASFTVNGRGIGNLALTVNDFSTKGSTASRILLSCKDEDGNPVRLEGGARLGPEPSLDLSLSAPSLSLKAFKGTKIPFDLTQGKGVLFLSARLHAGEIVAGGKVGCDQLAFRIKQGRVPIKGELDFTARYGIKKDEAALERCSLRINELVRLHARAGIKGVRKQRAFVAEIGWDEMDVKSLYAMMPQALRRDLAPGGRLVPRVIRLSGDGIKGITAASGGISLRGGELAKGGRALAKDVAADVALLRGVNGWELRGRLFQGKGGDGLPLQGVDAPFVVRFSDRLQPLQVEVPSLTARLMGVPVSGALTYRPTATNPLSLMLDLSRFPLPSLNQYIAGQNAEISAGTATVSIHAAGRGPDEFQGKVSARLLGLRGAAGGKKFTLEDAATEAAVSGVRGRISVAGRLNISGGLVNGKNVGASCAYGLADRKLFLTEGSVKMGDMEMRFADIRGDLPVKAAAAAGKRLPLRIEFSDIGLRGDGVDVSGLAGSLNADFMSIPGQRWLEGAGAVAVRKLSFKGNEIGSLAGRLRFAKSGAAAEINGKVLGGSLAGMVSLDPFVPEPHAGFSMNLTGAQGVGLGRLLAGAQAVKITGGLMDASLEGSYAPKAGLSCRMVVNGKGVTLAGKGGKTLLSDGGLRAQGDLAGGAFRIREGVVSVGKDLELRLKGELARAASPDRAGEIALSLGATHLDSLLDAFINLLPRPLQEAKVGGTLAASGKVRIRGKNIAVDGEAELGNARLEIPAQKLTIADIRGNVPFSLDLSGSGVARTQERPSFSRENYAALLSTLRQGGKSGRPFTIGKISFGPLEFGETTLMMRAGDGLMEITSLKSGLSEGRLVGLGFFQYRNGPFYGGDILVNDLSLRAFCDSYPAIKGYISGRLDGIISLRGEGKGLNGLAGFVDLWTRSGKKEKMLVSKEFLQKLAGKKLKGIFFRDDRPYDRGEISAYLEKGYLTFEVLDISHTTIFGIKDLSVSVAPVQNRIAVGHLFTAIKEAAARGKKVQGGEAPAEAPVETEFKWQE